MESFRSPEPVEESHQRLLPADVLGRQSIDRLHPFLAEPTFRSGEAGVATPADPETLTEYERGAVSALWAASQTVEWIQNSERLRPVGYDYDACDVAWPVARNRRSYTVATETPPVAIESSAAFQDTLMYGTDETLHTDRHLFALARPISERSLRPTEARQNEPEVPQAFTDALQALGVGDPDESRFGIKVTALKLLVTSDVDNLLHEQQGAYSERQLAEMILAEGSGSLIATVSGEWFSFDIAPGDQAGWARQASIFIAEQLVHQVREYHRGVAYQMEAQRRAVEWDEYFEEYGVDDRELDTQEESEPPVVPLLSSADTLDDELQPEELGFRPWPDADYKSSISQQRAGRRGVGHRPARKSKAKR